eukprot:snap_masked-scaffold_3-processed-gene-12.18-mRNA-1 protein AED:0.01 eAED:0.01 QI:0/-1/0/1/-1/1/1/0/422
MPVHEQVTINPFVYPESSENEFLKVSNVLKTKNFKGRTRKIMNEARLRHRTDILLAEWSKYKYYETFNPSQMKEFYSAYLNKIERITATDYDIDSFKNTFENNEMNEHISRPCLVRGLCDEWPAKNSWKYDAVRKVYGERLFKCGEDDDGKTIRVKLKHFLRYMNHNKDDSPLYIFESGFDDDNVTKNMLKEYSVPHLFREDLFQYVGEEKRPPYRWVLFGPERSGSTLHIDPLGTSAWNSLLSGEKLWVLFPPKYQKREVNGRHEKIKGEDDEAIDYFANLLPRILTKSEEKRKDCIMFVQKAGETVFVPFGWWHAVLNLSHTVAVTQNFCSRGNFDSVWRKTRTGRTRMAVSWLRNLPEEFKDLVERAKYLDKIDGFSLEARIKKMNEKLARKRRGEEVSSDSDSDSYDSSSSDYDSESS